MEETKEIVNKYVSILSDGKFHQTVEGSTEGAVVREYEDKEGNKKQKTELVLPSIGGIIEYVSFKEGTFGKNINIKIGDYIVSTNVTQNFGESLMKKLPNIEFAKPVKLTPFNFEKDGKLRRGVTIYQNGAKIKSYYYDFKNKCNLNGLPKPEGDVSKFESDDWKIYFMLVRKFLVSETKNLPVFKEFETKVEEDELKDM